MKQLVTIVGPNAVGKSTTAKRLVEQFENIAYVDSDWCSAISTVVFTYGWQGERKEIYEGVIEKLRNDCIDFQETIIILKCSKDENMKRAIQDGRDEARIRKGMEKTFSFYNDFNYPCIDTTDMTPLQVARKVASLVEGGKLKK